MKQLTAPHLVRTFGKWDIKELDINRIEISRQYQGAPGNKYTERFYVTIDLKPEIKKAIRSK